MKKITSEKLKSEYESFEIRPSEDLWENIAEALDKKDERPNKKMIFTGIAASLLMAFGLSILFWNNDSDKILTAKTVSKKENKFQAKKYESIPFEKNEVQTGSKNEIVKVSKPPVFKEKTSEKADVSKNFVNKNFDSAEEENAVAPLNNETSVVAVIPEKKAETTVKYTNAKDLLLGRELEEITLEHSKNGRQVGVLDGSKIRIKNLGSVKIFGLELLQKPENSN